MKDGELGVGKDNTVISVSELCLIILQSVLERDQRRLFRCALFTKNLNPPLSL